MSADQIVRDFCAAWGRGDVEAIMGSFADDAVYHNIPMDPMEGVEAIRTFIATFIGSMAKDIHFEIVNQVTAGNLVLNERVDSFTIGDRRIELPVCGVFELDDAGRVQAWRDYFDAAQFAGS